MRWSDLPLTPSPRMLRQFAGLWIVFFGGQAAWHGLGHGETRVGLVLATVALTGGIAGILRPSVIRPVFVAWLALAFPIGWVVSRVILVVLFALITPIALLFRLLGRDALQLRRPAGRESYWSVKPAPDGVKSYLRQF